MVAVRADAAARPRAGGARRAALPGDVADPQSSLPQGMSGSRRSRPWMDEPKQRTYAVAGKTHLSRFAQPAPPRAAEADRRQFRDAAAARRPAARRRRRRDAAAGRNAARLRACASRARRPTPAGCAWSSGACMRQPVLAADTTVVLRRRHPRQADRPRGRGGDAEAAVRRRSTRCYTAVAVAVLRHGRGNALSVTEVWFRELDATTRSGATSRAASRSTRPAPTRSRAAPPRSSTRIDGSYSGIMGLPLVRRPSQARCGQFVAASRTAGRERGNPHQRHAAGDARRGDRAGRRAGAARRAQLRRAAWSATSTWGASAACCPACSPRSSRSACERAAFLHVADIWGHRQNGTRRPTPIERILARRPDPAGAGGQGSDRHQGRAAVHADQHRRALARLPAAGIAHRHLAAHRGRGRARAPAREAAAAAAAGGERAASSSARWPRRPPTASCSPTSTYLRKLWARHPGQARATAAPPALLYQDLNLALRVLRDFVQRGDRRASWSIRARRSRRCRQFAQQLHAQRRRAHRALPGRAAAVRPLRRRGRDREGAGAARRPEVRRLPHHRPDRGADHGRRQHRRLRRRAQLRRHHLQDQPRGRAGDRAPAAAAQPRRHHHHRLHRHGQRGAPQRGARRVPQGARARPHAHDGERLHAARPGRDDAQAHARSRSRTCCASPARCARAAASSRPRRPSATRSCASSLREARQFNAREFRILASQQVIDMFLDEESQSLAMLGGLHRQADLAAGRDHLHPGAVRHRPDVAGGGAPALATSLQYARRAAAQPVPTACIPHPPRNAMRPMRPPARAQRQLRSPRTQPVGYPFRSTPRRRRAR